MQCSHCYLLLLFCFVAVVFRFVFTTIWFQMTFKGMLVKSFCLLLVQVFSQFYSRDPFKSVSGWFLVQVCVDFDLGTCSDQHWFCRGPVQNCLNVDLAQETSSLSQCWFWPRDVFKSVSVLSLPRGHAQVCLNLILAQEPELCADFEPGTCK